ncbi:MAG: ZIP family metal transporter [Proteobacteria bacterium]|nr:ZIP family metal transporter [Pseudomonadota bacterium]
MILTYIVAATLVSGTLSVLLAATLTAPVLGRLVKHLVSLSTGVLLATALLHMLPEAFELHTAEPSALFGMLLAGILFFFLLEKAELYRHTHHHEGDGHHHHHHFDVEQAGRGGMVVLVGDSIHNFCDGVIIAGAFLVSPELGLTTAVAILLHEIPQEVGDTLVLVSAGFSLKRALAYNALSGLAAVAGGVIGYFVMGRLEALFPYFMVVAAASLIYVAVADLIPQMQRRLPWRELLAQVAWIGAGVLLIWANRALMHGSGHGH